jgi:threonyl-tRNA synthetase
MERFVAVLIEHCEGKFPLWLTPEQATILPISEKYNQAAKDLSALLNNSDIRSLVDERAEKIGKKIRDAELQRIPYMLILGEKEVQSGQLSVRQQGKGDLGSFSVEEFKALIEEEIDKLLHA